MVFLRKFQKYSKPILAAENENKNSKSDLHNQKEGIQFLILLIIFITSLLFISCSNQMILKGKYTGYREQVDYRHPIDYEIVLQEIIPPSESTNFLRIKVAKREILPVYKIDQYEKIIKDNANGIIIGGTVIGGIASLPGFFMMGDSSDVVRGRGVKTILVNGIVGTLTGMLIGSLIYSEKVDKSDPFENKTTTILKKVPGDIAGPAPEQTIQIKAPFLKQSFEVVSDDNGIALVDLASKLLIDEWKSFNHHLEIEISVANDTKKISVDPNYFLRPYIKITRKKDNIRSGPGTNYAVIANCFQNEMYQVKTRQGNWLKIEYYGKSAWLHQSNGEIILASEYRFDPSRPPKLLAKATFIDPSGNGFLDAEEKARLRISVQNIGKGPDYNLRVIVKPKQLSRWISLEKEVTIGNIFPGKRIEKDILLTADFRVPDYQNLLRLEFVDQLGFPPDPIEVSFRSRHELKPTLSFRIDRIDDDNLGNSFGDNDQQIEAGETIEVSLTVSNNGEGTAENVGVILESRAPNLYIVGKKQYDLGNISPAASKAVHFAFSTTKLYNAGNRLPLYVTIKERRQRYSIPASSLGLEMNRYMPQTQILTVTTSENKDNRPSEYKIEEVPRSSSQKPYAVAVIIGNRDYQKANVPKVEFATRDAALMRRYIIQLFGYLPENVIYVENASKADFEQIFGTITNPEGKLAQYIKPWQSEVFIYYTGHGAPDLEKGESYFVPVDCDPNYVRLTGYPLNLFYRNIGKLKVQKLTVVIDACFSGQSSAGYLIKNISSLYLKIKDPILQIPNLNLFTSSMSNQVSNWYEEQNHSLFTFFFLAGIKKQWQESQLVKMGVLFDYLSKQVNQTARRLYGRDQNPTFIGDRAGHLF
ncbi:MAG: hypothetical protein D6813_09550 [Calditrichaeota bacterium]|nr:MAG: hypothetical protein D6813_09550 [Calditrichota bacterium]